MPLTDSTAPQIPGYAFVKRLGSGSTANVYLYEGARPKRQVAVKVSRSTLDERQRRSFLREADIMGTLSTHPYILSTFGSGMTDDGKGYLILEYAPHGSYKEVMNSTTLNAGQVLDLGIKLCGALVTAHAHGIVHHDIKPGNILISEHGLPLLSDFGISTIAYERNTHTGFSVPWAAPEVLTEVSDGDELSDIYSLAASLFALLTGRSPFEYGYHPHTPNELAGLIVNRELPRIGNPDVPQAVERVLRRAMSKDTANRYASALKFARALQHAQDECAMTMTPLVAQDVQRYPTDARRGGQHAADVPQRPVRNVRNAKTEAGGHVEGHSHISTKTLSIALAALAALVAVVLVFALVVVPHEDAAHSTHGTQISRSDGKLGDNKSDDNNDTDDGTESSDQDEANIPSVTDLKGTLTGASATFTWTNPDPKSGDSYAVSKIGETGEGSTPAHTNLVHTTTVTLDADAASTQSCIQVSLVRANGHMSATPQTACAVRQ